MNDELLDLKIVRIDRIYRGLTAATIRQWLAERRVLPDDLVRPVGAEAWMKVSLAPELSPPPVADIPPVAPALPKPLPRRPAANTPVAMPRAHMAPPAAPGAATSRAPAAPAPAATPRMNTVSAGAVAVSEGLGIPEPAMTRPRRKRRQAEDTELDMTPMIDVTFQLLIFFMLANQLANPAPVEVPMARYGKGVTPDGKQSILMDEAGRYYLGEHAGADAVEPSLDAVIRQVSDNASGAPQPLEVIINAHKRVKHQPIRELLEKLGQVPNLGPIHLGVEEQQ